MAFNEHMDPTHQKKNYEMAANTEDVDPTQWKEKDVSLWLNTLGLGDYGQMFMKHHITGDVLQLLSREDLKELGVNIIGHRVMLEREFQSLHKGAVNRARFQVHWEADQIMHFSGVFKCLPRPPMLRMRG